MRGFLLVWMLVLIAGTAGAGPWPRAEGRHFVSLAASGGAQSLWLERGIGGGHWLVLDATRGTDGALHGAVTLHQRLMERGAFSMAFTTGTVVERSGTGAMRAWARFGISSGVTLARPWPGWFTVDSFVDAGPGLYRAKTDITLGYRPGERWAVMMQLQTRTAPGQRVAVHLAPSALWRLREGTHLELGLRRGITGIGSRRTEVKIGTWLEF